MRRWVLIHFGALTILGFILLFWASVGYCSVVACTGAVYQALQDHVQGDHEPLYEELIKYLLRLRRPWSAVHLLGLVVTAVAASGFTVAWKGFRS